MLKLFFSFFFPEFEQKCRIKNQAYWIVISSSDEN